MIFQNCVITVQLDMPSYFTFVLLFGITFLHAASLENEIECQMSERVDHKSRQCHYIFLVNKQAALVIGQILIEAMLLKNYMKKEMHGIRKYFKTNKNKQILNSLDQLNQPYSKKDDIVENPAAAEHINVFIQNVAITENGLKWIYKKIDSELVSICQRKKSQVGNMNKIDRLCTLVRKIVEEKYESNRRSFDDKKDCKMMDSAGGIIDTESSCFGMLCRQCKAKSEANQKLREEHIKQFLHDIWCYALSFVLIQRGDTEIESEKSPYNWPLEKYGGAGDGITDEVQYLTYWPIKMLRQIGSYSSYEFTGSAISDYMKITFGGNAEGQGHTVHVCLKREEMQQNEQPNKFAISYANSSAVNADFQQKPKGNPASTDFKFSDLAGMEAYSIDECECEQGR